MFILILQLIATVLSTLVFPAIKGDCYVKSGCLPSTAASCYDWLNVTEHFNHCIKVCNVLIFSPGTYFLNGTLFASNHTSISIIGASSLTTSIICVGSPSLFVAVNISMLKIMNISWINCGGTFEHVTIPRSYTAILLHNVMSAEISNVVFNNSHGYALFGVDLHIQLSLTNVTITDQTSLSHTHGSRGIMLLNIVPTSTSKEDHYQHKVQKCFVLIIHNCKFHNMHSNGNNTEKDYSLKSSYCDVIIHQQSIVNISNITFASIVSDNIPVVLISDLPTLIVIVNSVFTNFSCIVVEVKTSTKSRTSSILQKFSFQDCTFSHNSATRPIQMIFFDKAVNITPRLELMNCAQFLRLSFTGNTTIGTIQIQNTKRNINSLNTSALIEDCDGHNDDGISDSGVDICYCESNVHLSINCSKTILDYAIYPGQTISLPLISTSFNLPVSIASYDKEGIMSVCENVSDNICFPFPQLQMVYQTCTNLTYMIKSNSTDWCMLCFKPITQQLQNNVLYKFNITLKECPLGLILYNGSCICNPALKRVIKGLTCNPDGTLIRPPYTWISAVHGMHNVTDIVYVTECYMDYCSKSFTIQLDLNDPDAQCLGNRSGKMCGRCAKGLSAVFGTTRCKRCTNIWLLLIPVLAVAGILLVWMLFALNLTVKDGHLYGYILFVNSLSLYSSRIFPSHYLIYFPILMSDLDLGIEVCFYNGMTSYITVWLQFVFPAYVILLVVGLSFASRYSELIERLTRKRIIPVIATLYLLAYNKMMFITARGLFAYRRLHYLRLQKTETYWSLYTHMPLFGLQFSFLFAFCILILLSVLLPTTVLLVFSKPLLKYKLVAKYFKPFLDAYQAPFKDNCYYFLGLELIMRVILYGCESLRADYTALVYAITVIFYLAISSFLQPFKSSLNTFIYTMYLGNLGCIAILIVYYPISKPKMYTITFNCLVGMGFAMFLMIILLHIYKYCKFGNVLTKCPVRFRKYIESFHTQDDIHLQEMELGNYVQYREDLLALDPND